MADQRRSSEDLLLGRTIAGKYTVESRVGGGGMGSVYRARQAGLDKTVAIKVLHRELLAEATFASRFKREATSASRIDHKNSLRVIDFGEEPDGLLYIAMEYLEGRSLFRILRDEAPLAPSRIVDLSRQILAALAAAHEIGIVHRDLKPENVIVLSKKDDEGKASEFVKVCDFGIAKLASKGEVDEKLTLEGSIIGTPEYLSPEQARGGELDARSDLYSMGVILFEALTGEPPYRGDTPLSIVLKHLDAPIPRPSSLTPTVDPKLEAVCLKALSKAPEDRFASAREMRAALATDSPDAAAAPRASSRSSHILLMTETPLPVSSTQAPLHLTPKRASAVSAARPRLTDLTEASSSAGARTMAAVVALALMGGGGGAYWLRKHPPLGHSGVAVAPALEAVVPAAAPPPPQMPVDPASPPCPAELRRRSRVSAVRAPGCVRRAQSSDGSSHQGVRRHDQERRSRGGRGHAVVNDGGLDVGGERRAAARPGGPDVHHTGPLREHPGHEHCGHQRHGGPSRLPLRPVLSRRVRLARDGDAPS